MYLLARNTYGGTATLDMGISKTDVDKKYEFYSGDPYKTDKEIDYLNYYLISVSSKNFHIGVPILAWIKC
jgi:hypothetical protein